MPVTSVVYLKSFQTGAWCLIYYHQAIAQCRRVSRFFSLVAEGIIPLFKIKFGCSVCDFHGMVAFLLCSQVAINDTANQIEYFQSQILWYSE
jgi:hypothetical protein